MIRYSELVQYIKDNHVNWNRDLFDVLKGFFEQYTPPIPSPTPNKPHRDDIISKADIFTTEDFKEPTDGEYTSQDLFNLLNT